MSPWSLKCPGGALFNLRGQHLPPHGNVSLLMPTRDSSGAAHRTNLFSPHKTQVGPSTAPPLSGFSDWSRQGPGTQASQSEPFPGTSYQELGKWGSPSSWVWGLETEPRTGVTMVHRRGEGRGRAQLWAPDLQGQRVQTDAVLQHILKIIVCGGGAERIRRDQSSPNRTEPQSLESKRLSFQTDGETREAMQAG